MSEFTFEPSAFVPFRDVELIRRLRAMTPEQLADHPNKDLTIRIVPDYQSGYIYTADILSRIQATAAAGEPCVLLLGNPNPGYVNLAHMINRMKIDCSHVHIFIVDEWADQDGKTAPESWPLSFMHAQKKYFFSQIDPKLRMPEQQVHAPSTANIDDYSNMIADFGGATGCYTGCGWTCHSAFIDPDVPEYSDDLDEFKAQGTQIVTLHPLTLAQNSLHACFGRSGDLSAVPPKAATIGPADVLGAKYRMDRSPLKIGGSPTSWQRLTARLILHGPVTPKIPASILQLAPTEFIIDESNAQPIEPVFYEGY